MRTYSRSPSFPVRTLGSLSFKTSHITLTLRIHLLPFPFPFLFLFKTMPPPHHRNISSRSPTQIPSTPLSFLILLLSPPFPPHHPTLPIYPPILLPPLLPPSLPSFLFFSLLPLFSFSQSQITKARQKSPRHPPIFSSTLANHLAYPAAPPSSPYKSQHPPRLHRNTVAMHLFIHSFIHSLIHSFIYPCPARSLLRERWSGVEWRAMTKT